MQEQWWPKSSREIVVARLSSNIYKSDLKDPGDTTLGYVVTKSTPLNSLRVVISEYGQGAIYTDLAKAGYYADAIMTLIASPQYKRYREKSEQIFHNYGIG